MKSKLNKVLVFILAFTLLFSCIPIQTFAASTYKIKDKLQFKDISGNISEINDMYPFELTLIDGYTEEIIDTTTIKPDGSFEFKLSSPIDVVYFGITPDQPARIQYAEKNAGIPADNFEGTFYIAAVDYTNYEASLGFAKSPEPVYIEYILGDAKVTKFKTGSNTTLPDAEFDLYYIGTDKFPVSDMFIETFTTDVNGNFYARNLPCGNYKVVEVAAPNGYFLNTTPTTFKVEENKMTEVKVYDEAKCSVTLTKKDSYTNETLNGVTFALYKANNQLIGTYVTTNGKIVVNDLHYGDYYFIETKTLDGYELDTTKYHFTLSSSQTSYEVTALNHPYPQITFEKIDADTSAHLTGAIFEVYKKGDNQPIHRTNGAEVFTLSLAPGEYVLKEVKAPTGYKPIADKSFVVESQTNQNITVKNEPYKTSLQILKVDGDTNQPLENVGFQLIGPVSTSWTSGKTAHTINNLVPGTYTLVESSPKEGYVVTENYTIVISDDCSSIVATQNNVSQDISDNKLLTVKNYQATLTINKQDSFNGSKLSGAEFKLYKEQPTGWVEYSSFTTSNTAYKKVGIPAGTYRLVETKIPVGYTMGDFNLVKGISSATKLKDVPNAIKFVIENTQKDNEITVYNNREYGSILINKTAKQIDGTSLFTNIFNYVETWFNLSTEKPLADVEFTLKAKENILDPCTGKIVYTKGSIVDVATTNENGVVEFDTLLFGQYTISETKTPNGYVAKDDIDVIIGSSTKTVELNISNDNETITINIEKTDSVTSDPLEGAVFGIYTEEQNLFVTKDVLIATVTTDANGEATYTGCVPKGKYFVKEISAPAGYLLSETKKVINFSEATGKITNEYNVSFTNDPLTLSIKKADATDGSNVIGAKLQLIDSNGSVYKEWITTANNLDINAIPLGSYTLKEIETPNGYLVAEDMPLTVTENSTGVITMTDNRVLGSLTVKKLDAVTKDGIQGVVFKIKRGNTELATATTNSDGTVTFTDLPVGTYSNGQLTGAITYTIEEVSAPAGYIISTASQNVTFDIRNGYNRNDINKEITFENDFTKLEIVKIDKETKEKIAGATLAIYNVIDINPDGSVKDGAIPYKQWVSSKTESYKIDKIPVGNYVLVELNTPEGYLKANNVEFSITDAGLKLVSMEDDFTKVEFLKTEKGTGNHIVGATLAIYPASALNADKTIKDNAVKLDEWTTNSNSNYRIDRLPIGNYVLVELSAPDGYVVADPVEFSVNADGNVQYVEMVDDYTKIEISKTEPDDKTPVEGANLVLYRASDINADGTVKDGAIPYDEWVSTKEAHVLDKIPVGDYVLVETSAPDGYTIATNKPIKVLATADVQYFVMENDFTKIKITKIEEGTEKNLLADAHLVIYRESDVNADGTIKDGATPIERWVSSNQDGYLINRLPVGSYILKEVIAPDGYILAPNKLFTVTSTPDLQEVELINEYTKASFRKIDLLSGDYLAGAVLALYKAEDVNADGTIKDGADFIDKWTTDNKAHNIYRLPVGNYVLVELSAPEGYVKADNLSVEIKAISSVQEFTLENDYTKLYVYKLEKGTTENVEDAKLGIFKAEDMNPNNTIKTGTTPVKEWTSGSDAKYIEKLPAGDYYLVELNAPKGYVTAKPVKFTIEPITTRQTVVMEDDYIKVEFIKTDIETKETLSGAHFSLYKAEDVNTDGTIKNGANPFDTWISASTSYSINYIPAGDYVLVETKAPTGYVRATNKNITVEEIGTLQSFTVENDFTKLSISKVDKESGRALAGANFALYNAGDIDADGNVKNSATALKTWTSTEKAYTVNRLPVGDYAIVETKAPAGYVRADIKYFSISETSETKNVIVENDYTKISISKVDIDTNEHVIGAELGLYLPNQIDNNGNVIEGSVAIDKWTTDGKAHLIEAIPVGDYVLVEISSPDGYLKAENQDIKVLETADIQSFIMKDDYTKIIINKLDKETNEFVQGAHLQLIDSEGNIVTEWDTTDKGYSIDRLPVGTYLIKETSSPNGYLISEIITINVKPTSEVQTFDVIDDFIKVEISKTDIETNKTIAGATLQLYDSQGNLVDEWISTDKPYRLDRLPVGTYKLVEIAPPAGYLLNSIPVEIIVTDTAEIQSFEIKNKFDDYDVTISKVDATTKKELPGATLVLKDSEGNVIEEWVSSSIPHIIEGLLPGTYTLTEITAPNGYFKAESITFELLPDGKTVNTTIVMENDYTKVAVYKYISGSTNFLAGAKLHIEDMDGNIVVEQWITGKEPHFVYGLPAGKYVLVEDEAPLGYNKSAKIEFEVTNSGEIVKVVMEDEYQSDHPEIPDTGEHSNDNNAYISFGFCFFILISSLIAAIFVFKKKTYSGKNN